MALRGVRRGRMDRQFAEHAAEALVLVMGQLLAAEEHDEVFHQRVVHFVELLVAERVRQVHAADLSADMRRQLPDLDRLIRHRYPPVRRSPRTIPRPLENQARERTIRAGFPTAKVSGGRSRVTTLPAPITQPSPIVTPASTMAPPPIHTPSPIRIGFAYSRPAARVCRSSGWKAVYSCTAGPICRSSPISIGAQSRNTQC